MFPKQNEQHLHALLQVGDQLDRGDNEIQILYFLERLQKEAAAAGGALHILNGNHETMNVGGRFRYATQPGRIDFLRWQLLKSMGEGLKVCLFCLYNQFRSVRCGGMYGDAFVLGAASPQEGSEASKCIYLCIAMCAVCCIPSRMHETVPLTTAIYKDVLPYGKHVLEHSLCTACTRSVDQKLVCIQQEL